MLRKRSSKHSHGKSWKRGLTRSKTFNRHPCIEPLESRQLLSFTLPVLTDQTVLAGAPLNLALNGSDTTGNALNYSVLVSNANLTNSSVSNPQLTATVPQGNPTLRLIIDDATDGIHGEVDLQLFKDLVPQTVVEVVVDQAHDLVDGLRRQVLKQLQIHFTMDPVGGVVDYKPQGRIPLGDCRGQLRIGYTGIGQVRIAYQDTIIQGIARGVAAVQRQIQRGACQHGLIRKHGQRNGQQLPRF